jgi:DNA-binding MarR family transcriptional regulator
MNETVALLRQKRLISRRESPGHRRILHIRLTSSGRRLLERCDRDVDRLEREAFRGFESRELALFREFLHKALQRFVARQEKAGSQVPTSVRSNGGSIEDHSRSVA